MNLILFCVWADQAVLGSTETAQKKLMHCNFWGWFFTTFHVCQGKSILTLQIFTPWKLQGLEMAGSLHQNSIKSMHFWIVGRDNTKTKCPQQWGVALHPYEIYMPGLEKNSDFVWMTDVLSKEKNAWPMHCIPSKIFCLSWVWNQLCI